MFNFNPTTIKAIIVVVVLLILAAVTSSPPSKKRIKKAVERQRERAKHVAPEKSLIKRRPYPGAIVLGKHGKKYVCWDTQKDGHMLIIGGSGSGKSSACIIPALMTNDDKSALVIDVKGELSLKARDNCDTNVCIVDPYDRTSFGFDPLFSLSEDCTLQEVKDVVEIIVRSLITPSVGSDSYWTTSAKSMLTGLLGYYIMEQNGKKSFISAVDSILGTPIKAQINTVINNAEHRYGKGSFIYEKMIEYHKMADDQLHSVFSSVTQGLNSFCDDGLRYILDEAERKVDPAVLEEGKTIFLSIPEHRLAPYSPALAMIVNLTLDYLSEREESPENKKIMIVLDELGRIVASGGCMENLINASMTLRSKKVMLVMAVQQIESLLAGFKEHEITTLVGNCNIKLVFDASSSKTQKMVCEDWIEQIVDVKKSTTDGSKNRSSSDSYEVRNTLTPGDLTRLVPDKEVVVITPYGYSLLKKCSYYEDRFFDKKAKTIIEHNKQLRTIIKEKNAKIAAEKRKAEIEELKRRRKETEERRMAKKDPKEKAIEDLSDMLVSFMDDDDEDE